MRRIPVLITGVGLAAVAVLAVAYLTRPGASTAQNTDSPTTEGYALQATTTPTPAPSPATPGDCLERMREHMDSIHGQGTFDAMHQWMEEQWGAGAFESMLQSCPHGSGGMTPGQGMMDGGGPMHGGGSGQGMMGPGGGMMDSGGTMGPGGGMMGGGGTTGPGGMMGGSGR